MAQVYSIDGVAITNRVRTTADPSGVEGLPSSAWYGEAMIAGVTIEDPLGELDLMGWHTFTHDETSCVGAERTFTGWITGKDISRGSDRQKQGAARIWDCEIIDQNAVWKLKLFRAASAKRPAETDNARMDFMLASAPMAATPVADNGRWNTTDNPVSFGPADYITQYPVDLANSVAGTSGKNFYAYWDDAAGEISGHYDLTGANPLSTIAISNVIEDRDATTVYPFIDAVLTRSPEDQVNGVLFGYQGGNYVYAQNPTLFGPGEFSPVNFDRDVLYTTDRVGLLSTANALATAQLAARSAEHDTLVVTVQLPPEQVNLLHAGMRVASRFSHLPSYEAEGGVQLAVIRRNVVPPRVRGGDYTLRLELSNMAAPTGPGGGGEPGPFEPIECDAEDATIVQSKYAVASTVLVGSVYEHTVTLDADPTPGNMLVVGVYYKGMNVITDELGATFGPGWQRQEFGSIFGIGGDAIGVAMWTKIADAADTTTLTLFDSSVGAGGLGGVRFDVQEWNGVDTVNAVEMDIQDSSTASGAAFIQVTPTPSGTAAVLVGAFGTHGTSGATSPIFSTIIDDTHWFAPASAPGAAMCHKIVSTPAANYDILAIDYLAGGQKWVTIGLALTCSGTDQVPAAGMHVKDETVTMVGDTGTTRFPFIAGSLVVHVDDTNQTPAIIDQDPDAGTFQLAFTPTPTELVKVDYQAAAG